MVTSSARAAAYRRRMVQAGWREIRIWVPDTRAPEKRSSLAGQGRAIAANTAEEADVLELIESWQTADESA